MTSEKLKGALQLIAYKARASDNSAVCEVASAALDRIAALERLVAAKNEHLNRIYLASKEFWVVSVARDALDLTETNIDEKT